MDTYDRQERELRALAIYQQFVDGQLGGDETALLAAHPELADELRRLLRADRSGVDRIGPFRVVRELGRGAMGVVFEAVDERLDARVAIKRLTGGTAARFHREAMFAAGLDHPSIARVRAFPEVEGENLLIMDLIVGSSLSAMLQDHRERGQVLDVGFVLAAFHDLADALAYAHGKSVIHRDVKPSNILIAESGRAVLTDFGIAWRAEEPHLTQEGAFAGTVLYAAPEQLAGRTRSESVDVFSLGVSMFEALAGTRPYQGQTIDELLAEMRGASPPDVRRRRRDIDRDLGAILQRAIEPDPRRRYLSGRELLADLRRYREGHPTLARPLSVLGRALRWTRRNPAATAVIAVLLGSAALAGILANAAARSLEKYDLLRVGAATDDLERRQAQAYPAWPERAAELDALVRHADDLVARIPELEAAAAALAAGSEVVGGAAVGDGGAPADDRPAHPAEARIAELDAERRHFQSNASRDSSAAAIRVSSQRIEEIGGEIAWLEPQRDAWRGTRIRDARARFLHDRLMRQVFALRLVQRDTRERLHTRARWAATIRAASIDEYADRWAAVAERVAKDDRYGGIELAPQIGLVPIGRDPESGLEEFGHLASGRVPQRGEDGSLGVDESSGIVFVLIRAGVLEDPNFDRKLPIAPFFFAKHEVSRAQWSRLAAGARGLRLQDGGVLAGRELSQAGKPANAITWHMAHAVAVRHGLTLPKEVEWSFVAQLANETWQRTSTYAAPRMNLRDLSYIRAHGGEEAVNVDDGFPGLAPVFAMKPDGVGIHHLFGNVKEWCLDTYSFQFIGGPDSSDRNPLSLSRVVRSGAWNGLYGDRSDRLTAASAVRSIGARFVRPVLPATPAPARRDD